MQLSSARPLSLQLRKTLHHFDQASAWPNIDPQRMATDCRLAVTVASREQSAPLPLLQVGGGTQRRLRVRQGRTVGDQLPTAHGNHAIEP